eukprot:tig00000802_g4281.t1
MGGGQSNVDIRYQCFQDRYCLGEPLGEAARYEAVDALIDSPQAQDWFEKTSTMASFRPGLSLTIIPDPAPRRPVTCKGDLKGKAFSRIFLNGPHEAGTGGCYTVPMTGTGSNGTGVLTRHIGWNGADRPVWDQQKIGIHKFANEIQLPYERLLPEFKKMLPEVKAAAAVAKPAPPPLAPVPVAVTPAPAAAPAPAAPLAAPQIFHAHVTVKSLLDEASQAAPEASAAEPYTPYAFDAAAADSSLAGAGLAGAAGEAGAEAAAEADVDVESGHEVSCEATDGDSPAASAETAHPALV